MTGGGSCKTREAPNRAWRRACAAAGCQQKMTIVKTGPKPTPTAIKRLHGNPGRRALPKGEPEPELAGVEPPQPLNAVAREEWDRLTPVLLRLQLLSVLDLGMLALWCCAWADFCEARQQLASGLLQTDRNGHVRRSPWLLIQAKAADVMLKCSDRLGFSPSARVGLASLPNVFVAGVPGANGDPLKWQRSALDEYLKARSAISIRSTISCLFQLHRLGICPPRAPAVPSAPTLSGKSSSLGPAAKASTRVKNSSGFLLCSRRGEMMSERTDLLRRRGLPLLNRRHGSSQPRTVYPSPNAKSRSVKPNSPGWTLGLSLAHVKARVE
jgi:P27 family predicted phage terminase small subunit